VRIVVQRVTSASVAIEGRDAACIGHGFLLLVGVEAGDDAEVSARMGQKVAALRLFLGDVDRAFDRTLGDVGGEALVVSQFTLMGDVRRGNRPSWARAAPPDEAEPLVDQFVAALRGQGIAVGTGVFGASMDVTLVNEGPVTLVLDSGALAGPRRA
jgi:D-aminoacyl-tRNA deacylase